VKTDQGAFYSLFEHVVLLSTPADVLLARVAARTSNPYGKTPEERAEIVRYIAGVEPLLRASATHEVDTSVDIYRVVERLEQLVSSAVVAAGV
jgi:hypothetical protein